MSIPSIPMLSPGFSLDPSASIKRKDSPEKLRETASQFEALMIGQILKNAQEDNQGVDGDQDDTAASTMDFASDFFSRSLAAKGGLGLAQVITNAVEKHASNSNHATGGSSPVDTPPSE